MPENNEENDYSFTYKGKRYPFPKLGYYRFRDKRSFTATLECNRDLANKYVEKNDSKGFVKQIKGLYKKEENKQKAVFTIIGLEMVAINKSIFEESLEYVQRISDSKILQMNTIFSENVKTAREISKTTGEKMQYIKGYIGDRYLIDFLKMQIVLKEYLSKNNRRYNRVIQKKEIPDPEEFFDWCFLQSSKAKIYSDTVLSEGMECVIDIILQNQDSIGEMLKRHTAMDIYSINGLEEDEVIKADRELIEELIDKYYKYFNQEVNYMRNSALTTDKTEKIFYDSPTRKTENIQKICKDIEDAKAKQQKIMDEMPFFRHISMIHQTTKKGIGTLINNSLKNNDVDMLISGINDLWGENKPLFFQICEDLLLAQFEKFAPQRIRQLEEILNKQNKIIETEKQSLERIEEIKKRSGFNDKEKDVLNRWTKIISIMKDMNEKGKNNTEAEINRIGIDKKDAGRKKEELRNKNQEEIMNGLKERLESECNNVKYMGLLVQTGKNNQEIFKDGQQKRNPDFDTMLENEKTISQIIGNHKFIIESSGIEWTGDLDEYVAEGTQIFANLLEKYEKIVNSNKSDIKNIFAEERAIQDRVKNGIMNIRRLAGIDELKADVNGNNDDQNVRVLRSENGNNNIFDMEL